MPASIEIDFPLTGSDVPQIFSATGTFVPDAGMPTFACELRQSGVVVSSGNIPPNNINLVTQTWQADFTVSSATSGLTLHAAISDGSSDAEDQPGITVDASPPIQINPLPTPPPPLPMPPIPLMQPAPVPSGAAAGPLANFDYTVTGVCRGDVAMIECDAFLHKIGDHSARPRPTGAPVRVKPQNGRWSAKLNLPQMAQGFKLGVRATAFDKNGNKLKFVDARKAPKK
jgi:hypothetical protein